MIDTDRPEAHLNLGLLETRLRHASEAETQHRTALRLNQNFTPTLVNLADLDRMGWTRKVSSFCARPRLLDLLHNHLLGL